MLKKYFLLMSSMFTFIIPISSDVFAGKLLSYEAPAFFLQEIRNFYTAHKRPMDDEERREFVELVQSGRLPVDQLTEDGYSAIMLAAQVNDLETVRFLLNDRNINSINEKNQKLTLLHLAVGTGATEVVDLLIQAHANLDVLNASNYTALNLAAVKGYSLIVRLLIDAKANLDLPDHRGDTALMWAAHRDWAEIVLMLLLAGADYTLKNKKGNTALQEVGNKKTSEAILKYWEAISKERALNKFLEMKSKIRQSLGQQNIPLALSRFLEARGASLYVEDQLRFLKSKKRVSVLCFCCHHEVRLAEEEIIGQGPSGCSCVVCPECTPGFIRHQLEDCSGMDLICPQCKMTLDPHFFDKSGCTPAEVFKIGKAIFEHMVSQKPGWKNCKTPNCQGGRIVDESDSAFFSCPVCEFQGCLACGQNHRGYCRQIEDEEKATVDDISAS